MQGLFTFEIPRGGEVIECNKVTSPYFVLLSISATSSTAGAATTAEIALLNVPATLASKFLTLTDVGGACELWTTFPKEKFLAHIQGNITFGGLNRG